MHRTWLLQAAQYKDWTSLNAGRAEKREASTGLCDRQVIDQKVDKEQTIQSRSNETNIKYSIQRAIMQGKPVQYLPTPDHPVRVFNAER